MHCLLCLFVSACRRPDDCGQSCYSCTADGRMNNLLHRDIVVVDRINEQLFCFALQHRRQHLELYLVKIRFVMLTCSQYSELSSCLLSEHLISFIIDCLFVMLLEHAGCS